MKTQKNSNTRTGNRVHTKLQLDPGCIREGRGKRGSEGEEVCRGTERGHGWSRLAGLGGWEVKKGQGVERLGGEGGRTQCLRVRRTCTYKEGNAYSLWLFSYEDKKTNTYRYIHEDTHRHKWTYRGTQKHTAKKKTEKEWNVKMGRERSRGKSTERKKSQITRPLQKVLEIEIAKWR